MSSTSMSTTAAHRLGLDATSRTLIVETKRWRRWRVLRIAIDDIDAVEVRVTWRVLFFVRVVESSGASHVIAGPWFGRARAMAIARAVEEAAGLEPLPDDEWLCAVRAVERARESA